VDRSTGGGSGAQPVVWLCAASSGTMNAASPRRRAASCGGCATTTGGATQFRPQRSFAGSHLRRCLGGVPGDPRELGSLGPPIPRGARTGRSV
jgi:hypothetical protein